MLLVRLLGHERDRRAAHLLGPLAHALLARCMALALLAQALVEQTADAAADQGLGDQATLGQG